MVWAFARERELDEKADNADDTTAYPQAAPEAGQAEQGAGDASLPAEAGGLNSSHRQPG
jgi:hypothetical protein